MIRFKCYTCYSFFEADKRINGACPVCGETHLVEMCPLDRICECNHEIQDGITYCPHCSKPTCKCGSHDVEVISRVTGYLNAMSGMNSAKQQEIKDRQRYDIK